MRHLGSDKRIEAGPSRARETAGSQVEFASESLAGGLVMINLDDVACVQVTIQSVPLVVVLFEKLAVDGQTVGCTSPDAHMQVSETRPVFAHL